MLRIENESDGHTTTLQLSGRIQSANIGDIRAQMDDEHVRIFMDLGEVTLVDVEVVRFLSECEDRGIALVHCPPMFASGFFASESKGLVRFRHLASARHYGFGYNASSFNALAVGMVPAYLFAKADLGGSMTEASIDLQQATFRRRIRLHP